MYRGIVLCEHIIRATMLVSQRQCSVDVVVWLGGCTQAATQSDCVGAAAVVHVCMRSTHIYGYYDYRWLAGWGRCIRVSTLWFARYTPVRI